MRIEKFTVYPAPTTWNCDQCGEPVTAENGYVVWHSGDVAHGFRIIHTARCDDRSRHSSRALKDFVGQNGMAQLLGLLTLGPVMSVSEGHSRDKEVSLTDFTDLFRRLHIPNYERARPFFNDPEVREQYNDSNESAPYLPESLARFADARERQTTTDEAVTIDLNDPDDFTIENVSRLIGSQVDTQNWQLRVTKQGIAYLSEVTGSRDLDNVALRFETWGTGNNYVGFQAAHDERHVSYVYDNLRENWPRPKTTFID